MCFTSTIAGLDLHEIGLKRVFLGCESIASPCGASSRIPPRRFGSGLAGDALAAAADRQLLVEGLIQGFQLQVRLRQSEIVGKLRSARLAVADRRLPGQAGGLDRTARSSWHVVGGCLAGHSHGSGPEYHRRDESALDLC